MAFPMAKSKLNSFFLPANEEIFPLTQSTNQTQQITVMPTNGAVTQPGGDI